MLMQSLRSNRLVLLGLVLLASVAGCSSLTGKPAPSSGVAASLAEDIRALADDRMEGRGPGTHGDQLARQYIVERMKAVGLAPGMPDGTWEQPVDLVGITSTVPAAWRFRGKFGFVDLGVETDFVASSMRERAAAGLRDAEVVFAGYAIEAPEYQWDDFKGVDVRGKLLLVLNNDPDWDESLFAGKRRLYYGRWTYKFESAARHGAAGVLILHTTESASYPWTTVLSSWSGENSRLPSIGTPELEVQGWITEAAARRLAAYSGGDLDAWIAAARRRDFRPIPLGATTSIEITNMLRPYRTANVIGKRTGTDLANEAVIYTAHHDHLGIKADRNGLPVIHNGALDNAAGVAQMLAIAQSFNTGPPTRRSIYFAALAAEEQGLLGSEYLVRHPPIAREAMVANINFDGGEVLGRTRDVAVTGLGKSTIDRFAATAAAAQGRVLVDEPFPERGSFYRSDQFNFAKAGVPVLYARSGTDFVGRPPGWGKERKDEWVAKHYHQASDDFDPTWNFDGMIDDAVLGYEVGKAVANSDEVPAWMPGDEFERVRPAKGVR